MVDARDFRVSVNITAEVVKNGQRYEAIIDNLSDEGLMMTVFPSDTIDLSPGKKLDIEFKTPSGENVVMHCIIMRLVSEDKDKMAFTLGLRILEKSTEYEDFFKSVFIKEMGIL